MSYEITGDWTTVGEDEGDDLLDITGEEDEDFDLSGEDAESAAEQLLAASMGADYMVGARRRPRVGRIAAMLARMKAAKASTLVKSKAPQKGREYPLGFFFAAIPGAATVDVISRPQTIFRGERLVIPAAIGAAFNVVDVRVGNVSQLPANQEIPGAVFAETSFGVRLRLDTCQVAMDIVLRVRNITVPPVPADFSAAIIGASVQ